MSNIIETKNLSKSYFVNKRLDILKNINIKIKKGDLVALLGPSGSGKSTFLHLLALLDKPTKGKISILGKSTSDISEDKKNEMIRDHISIIFQNNNLLSDFTALENVAIPLIIRNKSYNQAIKEAEKFLKQVNLGHRLKHFPSDLSGGEQQRVAIARALINKPKIILADEPTGNLDGENSQIMMKLLLDYTKKSKTSLVLVTHDTSLAQRCDRIIELNDGNIV